MEGLKIMLNAEIEEEDNPLKVGVLQQYCEDTDDECDVYVYINNIPIGFGVTNVGYDFDGSLKIHINDEDIKIKEED